MERVDIKNLLVAAQSGIALPAEVLERYLTKKDLEQIDRLMEELRK